MRVFVSQRCVTWTTGVLLLAATLTCASTEVSTSRAREPKGIQPSGDLAIQQRFASFRQHNYDDSSVGGLSNDASESIRFNFLRHLEQKDDCEAFNHEWNRKAKCSWAQRCSRGKSLIPYSVLAFCHVSKPAWILAFYLPWAMLLFYLGGTVADNYLTPPMIRLAKLLRISDSLAGCTILALANATGDLLGGVSLAWSDPDALDLFVGDVFGASLFLTTVVFGCVIFVSRSPIVQLNPDSCFRDAPFFAGGLTIFLCLNFVSVIPTWACIPLFVAYVAYVYIAWYQMQRTPVDQEAIREYCELFHAHPPEETDMPRVSKELRTKDEQDTAPATPETITVAIHEPVPSDVRTLEECDIAHKASATTLADIGYHEIPDLDETIRTTQHHHPQQYHRSRPDGLRDQCIPLRRQRRRTSSDYDEKQYGANHLPLPSDEHRGTTHSGSSLRSFIASTPGSRFVESSFVSDISRKNPSLVALTTRPGKLLISQLESEADGEKGPVSPPITATQPIERPASVCSGSEVQERKSRSWKKIIFWPLYVLWNLTIPRVDPGLSWHWVPAYPFCITTFFCLFYWEQLPFQVAVAAIATGLVVSAATAWGMHLWYKRKTPPIQVYHKPPDNPYEPPQSNAGPVLAILGIVMALFWNGLFVSEVIQAILTAGYILNVSNEILGITILAWGNSAADLFANVAVSRAGHTDMGLTSAYGSSIMLMLFGSPLVSAISVVRSYVLPKGQSVSPYHLEPSTVLCVAAQIIISLSWAALVYCKGFRISRYWSLLLLIAFVTTTMLMGIIYFS